MGNITGDVEKEEVPKEEGGRGEMIQTKCG
jgi:hypothetical protein